jgi:cobalamin biosynthesis protein CbiM/cobalt ECF transporter T component CbiQ
MHITEGFLPISHCIAWGAASLPPTVVAVRAISKNLDRKRENRVLLAASAAFLFTLSSLRMPSITGSSSHPAGTSVGTYLFGAGAMPALALITLVFQALLLAHGGLTTLGANLFSLGIAGPWAMWLLLRFMLKTGWGRDRSIFVSTVVGDLATYVTTAVQLALAYPSAHGGFLASFAKFIGIFLITQIPIALAEGVLTVALLRALPEREIRGFHQAAAESEETGWAWKGLAIIGVLTALVAGMFFLNYSGARLGSDDRAETAVRALRPSYHPIAVPVWQPGNTAEGWLFVGQGAVGIVILGWVIYRLRRGRRSSANVADAPPQVRQGIHLHTHLSDIAFTNRWRHRNPWEKVLFGGGFLIITLLVPPSWCILIALIVSAAAVAGAQIPLRSWLAVLSVPLSFALLTALGILVQLDSRFRLSLDWNSSPEAIGLLVRSFAAISCLAFIGWTTPLMELIPVGARAGIPTVLVGLALMIYRFLFVMTTTLTEMRRAQSWRLGRADYKSRMRAASMLAGSLFVRCIQRVRRLEDGIEARGYDGHLWVLAPENGASLWVIGGTLALQVSVLVIALSFAKGAI